MPEKIALIFYASVLLDPFPTFENISSKGVFTRMFLRSRCNIGWLVPIRSS
jgi:hypothetical protein